MTFGFLWVTQACYITLLTRFVLVSIYFLKKSLTASLGTIFSSKM